MVESGHQTAPVAGCGVRVDGVVESVGVPPSLDQLSSNVTLRNPAFPQNPAAVLSSLA
jgi:hypothetical protein